MWFYERRYVSAAQKKARAAQAIEKQKKQGKAISPVVIEGRTIARTFWGKAWCDNLESYSDYENRLPRGRTYVRNGSVVDLQILPGKITAQVSGSSLYKITISITPLPKDQWVQIKTLCAGQIGSLVELLQGKLSSTVMQIVTEHGKGLFPKPSEIKLACSCPDWAGMCKHIAATLYGVGTRLDQQPELLFRLRQVDHLELIEDAVPATVQASTEKKTLETSELADVFGIELSEPESTAPATVQAAKVKVAKKPAPKRRKTTKSTSRK